MVSTLDIFEASVDEVLYVQFGDDNGDDLARAMLMALTQIVDGLTDDFIFQHLAPRLPVIVEVDGEKLVNDIWSANNTFGPIYACLADYFYQTIAPVDFPDFPHVEIVADEASMFGFRLVGMADRDGADDNQDYTALVAGCSALAAHQCVQQPVVIVLGYMIAQRRITGT